MPAQPIAITLAVPNDYELLGTLPESIGVVGQDAQGRWYRLRVERTKAIPTPLRPGVTLHVKTTEPPVAIGLYAELSLRAPTFVALGSTVEVPVIGP